MKDNIRICCHERTDTVMPLGILKVIRDGVMASVFVSIVDFVTDDNTPVTHDAQFVRRGDAEEIRALANSACNQGIVRLANGDCYSLMNSSPIWGNVA
jgi:hypothetical protein